MALYILAYTLVISMNVYMTLDPPHACLSVCGFYESVFPIRDPPQSNLYFSGSILAYLLVTSLRMLL